MVLSDSIRTGIAKQEVLDEANENIPKDPDDFDDLYADLMDRDRDQAGMITETAVDTEGATCGQKRTPDTADGVSGTTAKKQKSMEPDRNGPGVNTIPDNTVTTIPESPTVTSTPDTHATDTEILAESIQSNGTQITADAHVEEGLGDNVEAPRAELMVQLNCLIQVSSADLCDTSSDCKSNVGTNSAA
jgi:hypothetical protein